MTDDSEATVLRSWHRNAGAWTRAVREKTIASRRQVTGRAILETILPPENSTATSIWSVDVLIAGLPALLNAGGRLVIQTLHPSLYSGDDYRDGWRSGSWAGFGGTLSIPLSAISVHLKAGSHCLPTMASVSKLLNRAIRTAATLHRSSLSLEPTAYSRTKIGGPMTLKPKSFAALFMTFIFLSGCERESLLQHESAESADAVSADAIQWFPGSVEEAFAHAAAEDKPLFLYWGAVWCPPCEEINQTVFKDPNFLAQSRLFVPVYLDGDTGRAQTWGEHFAVQGYPTMIIFNADGEETTRIPGAIEVERYNDVLRLSLNGLRKTSTLLQQALQEPAKLSAEDFTQLAYYSWDQENFDGEFEPTPAMLSQLSRSADQAGNGLAASRLFLQSLVLSSKQEKPLDSEQQQQAQRQLQSILADQQLVLGNFDFSMFWPEEVITLVTEPGEGRRTLSKQWADSMAAVRQHPSLSKAEQLGSWYPQLHLYWLNNPEADSLPADVQSTVREHVSSMDENTRGSARQTVINKAYQVLQAARLYGESREMLLAEIEKSESPWYFMSGLASLAEKQNDAAAATDWLKRAYDAAEGRATRFQWGVEYVTGLIRLQPERGEEMAGALSGLLDNLEQDEDVFAGRNFGRLQTLRTALGEWKEKEAADETVKSFNDRLRSACEAMDSASIGYRNCSGLAL
jgi:thioredoxin-related protein